MSGRFARSRWAHWGCSAYPIHILAYMGWVWGYLGCGFGGTGAPLAQPHLGFAHQVAVILLLFWTINPTMTHLVAKAGLIHGVRPVEGTKVIKG